MRFEATCPLCKRTIAALSMAMLEIKAREHSERCAEQTRKALESRLAARRQCVLPLGGDS